MTTKQLIIPVIALLAAASCALRAQEAPCAAVAVGADGWHASFDSLWNPTTLPDACWQTAHPIGNGTPAWKKGNSYFAQSGTGSARLDYYYTSDGRINAVDLVTPLLDIPQAGAYTVSLWVRRVSRTPYYPHAGVRLFCNTTPDTVGATLLFFAPQHINTPPTAAAAGWYLFSAVLPLAGEQYIIIRGVDQGIDDLYVDELDISAPATCTSPDSLRFDGTEVQWAAGSATLWQVSDNDSLVVVNTPFYSDPDWPEAERHTVKVRSICAAGDTLDWRGPVVFTTPCNTFLVTDSSAYSLDFEGLGSGELPPCWQSAHSAGTSHEQWGAYSAQSSHSGLRVMRLPDMPSGNVTNLASPRFVADEECTFSLWVRRTGEGAQYPDEGVKAYYGPGTDTAGATLLFHARRCIGLEPVVESTGWYEYTARFTPRSDFHIILQGISQYGDATWIDDLTLRLTSDTATADTTVTDTLPGPAPEPLPDPDSDCALHLGTHHGYDHYSIAVSNWGNTLAQSLFTAGELRQAGLQPGDLIDTLVIEWKQYSTPYEKRFSIYVSPTAENAFDAAEPQWLAVEVNDLQFDGTLDTGVDSAVGYPLSHPLVWDGASGLVVTTLLNQPEGQAHNRTGFMAESSPTALHRTLFARRDNQPFSLADLGPEEPTAALARVNIGLPRPCADTAALADAVRIERDTTICQGQTVLFDGTPLNEAGTYTQRRRAATAEEPDTLCTLRLAVAPPYRDTLRVEAAGSYTWPATGATYTASGIHTATLSTAAGCDSILVLVLSLTYIETHHVTAMPNISYYGWVEGGGSCPEGDSITVTAHPHPYATFNGWRDGDTARVRTLVPTTDTVLIALFAPKAGIGDAAARSPRFGLNPNPASGSVTVSLADGASLPARLDLYSPEGRLVATFTMAAPTLQLPLDGLAAGTYLLRLAATDGTATRKLVVR